MAGLPLKRQRAVSTAEAADEADAHPKQVLGIECDGRIFRACRETWTIVPDSMLAIMVAGVAPAAAPATVDAFVDEDVDAFKRVVAYLKSRGQNDEPPAGDAELADYALTARRLGLQQLAASLELEQFRRRCEKEATRIDMMLERVRRCIEANETISQEGREFHKSDHAETVSFRHAPELARSLRVRRLAIQGALSRLPLSHRRRSTLVTDDDSEVIIRQELHAFRCAFTQDGGIDGDGPSKQPDKRYKCIDFLRICYGGEGCAIYECNPESHLAGMSGAPGGGDFATDALDCGDDVWTSVKGHCAEYHACESGHARQETVSRLLFDMGKSERVDPMPRRGGAWPSVDQTAQHPNYYQDVLYSDLWDQDYPNPDPPLPIEDFYIRSLRDGGPAPAPAPAPEPDS